jgi:uncharacterized membrane protein
MKRSLLYSAIAAFAALSFSSCSRQSLSLENTQQINAQQVYAKPKAVEKVAVDAKTITNEKATVNPSVKAEAAPMASAAPAVKHHRLSGLKNKVATSVAGFTAMRSMKSMVKAQMERAPQLLASNTKSVKAPKMGGYLGTAILLAVLALIFALFAGVNSVFGLISGICLILALVFLILWLVNLD